MRVCHWLQLLGMDEPSTASLHVAAPTQAASSPALAIAESRTGGGEYPAGRLVEPRPVSPAAGARKGGRSQLKPVSPRRATRPHGRERLSAPRRPALMPWQWNLTPQGSRCSTAAPGAGDPAGWCGAAPLAGTPVFRSTSPRLDQPPSVRSWMSCFVRFR